MTRQYLMAALITVVLSGTAALFPMARAVAEPLPEIVLEVPESADYRQYLGLDGAPGESFNLAEVEADVLVIELFSMYCPYCQAEAPNVNDFHRLAREVPEVNIRMVGLGASNTLFEVEHFRATFDIVFPLFPDKSLELYKKLGGEGTPTFLVCKMKGDGGVEIVLRQVGGFESPEKFLGRLLEASGYK